MTSEKYSIDTRDLTTQSLRLQRLLENTPEGLDKDSDIIIVPPAPRQIIFNCRGFTEIFAFTEDSTLIVGRDEFSSDDRIDLDLSRFGGEQRGVSRLHAQITLVNDNRIFIMDLDSTNGTYIDGERLNPYTPYLVKKDAQVVLGQLPVQIYFAQ